MRRSICRRSGAAATLFVATLILTTSFGGISLARAEAAATPPNNSEQQADASQAKRGWLGVKVQNIDEDTAAALGLPEPKGALVTEVSAGGPAAAAGLVPNDAILAINGQAIADGKDLARQISGQTPDSSIELKILRADKEHTLNVKLGAFNEASLETKSDNPENALKERPKLGLMLADGANGEGVMIAEVNPSSDAAEKGIASGDNSGEVDGKPNFKAVDVVENLKTVHEKGRTAVLLRVKSRGEMRSVSVRFNNVG